jgi:hypothetical protein
MQAINKDLMNPTDMLWVSLCKVPDIQVGNKDVIGLKTNIPNEMMSTSGVFSYLQVAKS